MKNIFYTIVLLSTLSFAQTVEQRNKIISTYDLGQIELEKQKAQAYEQEQAILIANFKQENPQYDYSKMSLQRVIDGVPFFFQNDNQGSAVTIRANTLYPGGSLGLNVTGQNMFAAVWDGGKVRDTHQELTGRILLSDAASELSNHATHVTGTIAASGISATRRGMAYATSVLTYDWTSDYTEMLNYGTLGYLVSNHSYGSNAASLPNATFGAYNSLSIEADNISNLYPFYQIVKSAGNDRATTSLSQVATKAGYDLLSGVSTAKNVLTVAAVNQVNVYNDESDVTMSSFSNYGPTDDGRIKPDISAKGVAVSSSGSANDTDYNTLQGTSMASPAITGLIVLLQKHYSNLNNSNFMRASMVRGLLCHSASEAGYGNGPDYSFGWGLADGRKAAQIISNKDTSSLLEMNTLSNGQTITKNITISNQQKLEFTICWTDPTAAANPSGVNDDRTPRLINNLDLKVFKDGTIYYPWKLDPINPSYDATNDSDNNVDNVEKIEIYNAQPGLYTIQVTHKGNLAGGSQMFALIGNGSTGLTLNTKDYDFERNIFIYPNPASDVLNYTIKNNFDLESIVINDVSGKRVYKSSNNSDSSQIDVSKLTSGVYFVTFTTKSSSVTKKFIKQ